MNSKEKKIWIDFTDLILWDDHFTGTQRVTYEIGKRFYENLPRVSFFAFDDKSKKFYEVPFQKINERILEIKRASETESDTSQSKPSLKKNLKLVTKKVYLSLPFEVKKRITDDQKAFIKKTGKQLLSVLSLARFSSTKNLSKLIKRLDQIRFNQNDVLIILGKPWDNMFIIKELRKQKLETNFTLVHLIYDMIPVFLPHVFGKPVPKNYTEYMFEAMSISDHLVAISESTKKDIKRFCDEENLPYKPTTVIKLGDSFSGLETDKKRLSELSPKDFLLCVGTLEIRKNHILLYTAYKEGLSRGVQMPKLVIVGGKGWYTNDVLYEFENDPEMKNRVFIKNNVSDRELAWLYKNCKFTVYPSVYEGWGLPITESLAYGKMCLASGSSSMKEIAGDLIEYFSPYDSAGFLELIIKYLDEDILSKKETEIKKHYKSTNWDKTFQDFVKVIKY